MHFCVNPWAIVRAVWPFWTRDIRVGDVSLLGRAKRIGILHVRRSSVAGFSARWILSIPTFLCIPFTALAPSAPPEEGRARAFTESAGLPGVVSYLYVEANEDGAAGGHVALRIGDLVYHYQRLPEGFFVLDRTPLAGFLFSYSRLQNRNIHELPLPADGPGVELLLERLNDRYIAHRLLVQRLHTLQERLHLLNDLKKAGTARISVPATGYFFALARPSDSESSFSLHARQALGQTVQPANLDAGGSGITDGSAEEIEDLQEGYLISLLSHGFAPAPGAFAECDLRLTFDEDLMRFVGDAWRRRMHEILLRPRMERPDRARTVLEILASTYSLEESIQRRRLHIPLMAFLEPGSNQRAKIAQSENPLHRDAGVVRFERAVEERISVFQKKAVEYQKAGTDCDDACAADLLFLWNRVSEAGARFALARRYGSLDAFDHGFLLTTPSYSRSMEIRYAGENIETALTRVEAEEGSLRDRAARELAYAILRRNCATELLRDLEEVLHLGIPVDHASQEGLFFPWISMLQMKRLLPGAKELIHLSYRNERLEAEPGFRERSTLTSRHYHFNSRDSLFLFFTEDAVLLRPLWGVINLGPALGQSMVGLILLPVKGPGMLSRGLRGMAFSVTEIAGVSIRKGTFRDSGPAFYDFPARRIAERGMQPGHDLPLKGLVRAGNREGRQHP